MQEAAVSRGLQEDHENKTSEGNPLGCPLFYRDPNTPDTMIEKKRKKGYISEEDTSSLFQRYKASTILALLQEVAQYAGLKIDWNTLVKKTSTGISSAREYQMLWRHLAYRDALLERLEDGAEPLDDDSDLEFELEAFPAASSEASSEAAACVKRWSIIRKRQPKPKAGKTSKPISSVASQEQLAANQAVSRALNMPSFAFTSSSLHHATVQVGMQPPASSTSPLLAAPSDPLQVAPSQALNQSQQSLTQATSQKGILKPAIKSRTVPKKYAVPVKPSSSPNPIVQVAVASIGPGLSSQAAVVSVTPNPSSQAPMASADLNPKTQVSGTLPSLNPVTQAAASSAASNSTSVGPNPIIQAAAFAAGGRIATPSTAASHFKAAQSKIAVHIRPGGSVVKSPVAGAKLLPGSNMSGPRLPNIRLGPPPLCHGVGPSRPRAGIHPATSSSSRLLAQQSLPESKSDGAKNDGSVDQDQAALPNLDSGEMKSVMSGSVADNQAVSDQMDLICSDSSENQFAIDKPGSSDTEMVDLMANNAKENQMVERSMELMNGDAGEYQDITHGSLESQTDAEDSRAKQESISQSTA